MNTPLFLDTKKLVVNIVNLSLNMDNKFKHLIGDKLITVAYRLFDKAKAINDQTINLKQRLQRVNDYLLELDFFKNMAEINLEVKALDVPKFATISLQLKGLEDQAKKLKFTFEKSLYGEETAKE
jgi:hypothetical protein